MIRRRWVVWFLILSSLTAACSFGSGSDDSAVEGRGDSGASAGGAVEDDSGVPPLVPANQVLQAPRQVVYTATIEVSVDDPTAATEMAVEIAEDAGGHLFSQVSDLQGDLSATLVLKVPPASFEAVMDALGELGKPLARSVETEDVTADVVDLEARLASARASADRLRALLADANTVPEVAAVESELARRESDIESMEGQLRVIRARVELATITVELVEPSAVDVASDLPGFLRGLRLGWVALVTVAYVGSAVAGFLVPFVPVVAAAWLVVWLLVRRRRRATPTP